MSLLNYESDIIREALDKIDEYLEQRNREADEAWNLGYQETLPLNLAIPQ